VIQCS